MVKNVILINDFDYIQGGASKVAIQTANILTEFSKGIKVYFFSAVHSKESQLNNKVIKISTNQKEALRNKNKFVGFINGIYNFKARKELKRLLNKLNKDETVIHVHGWTKALSSSVFDIAFKMKFKVIITMHDYFTACPNGGYFNYKKNKICRLRPLSLKCIKCNCDSRNYLFKLYRIIRYFVQNKIVKLNNKLTDVISISDFSEKILKKTLNPKIKIHRVYNPIDFDLNIQNEDFLKSEYFLNVGRISPEKGVEDFCKAITISKKEGIVVGDGPDKKKLEKKYPNIKFVGWKSSKEVNAFMKNAKCLVFSSKCFETMGLTVLEAMQFKIPVIANKNTAASDFIENKKNGFLYNTFDELIYFIQNVDKLKSNNYIQNFNMYNSSNYIDNLIKIYSSIGGESNAKIC